MSHLISHSFGLGESPIDCHKQGIDGVQRVSGTPIEANIWLPAAASCYEISPRLDDYVVIPVPVLYNDIPNTNGDCLTLMELLKFNPALGMQAFKTFRGKPTYREHANKDIKQAKGVIFDCFMRKLPKYPGYYKVVLLLGYDRSKDAMLCNRILSGQENSYSVGFNYTSYTCSICNWRVAPGIKPCSHTALKGPLRRTYLDRNNQLVYRFCENAEGFECSSVADPAYVLANSNVVIS